MLFEPYVSMYMAAHSAYDMFSWCKKIIIGSLSYIV